jgi:hypothetical protein
VSAAAASLNASEDVGCHRCRPNRDCLPGCIYQVGHDGDCMTDEDVAEGRLRARDYEGWAAL